MAISKTMELKLTSEFIHDESIPDALTFLITNCLSTINQFFISNNYFGQILD